MKKKKATSVVRGEADRDRTFPDMGVSIHAADFGLGVFADRNFRKGALIGSIEGLLLEDNGMNYSDYCMDAGPYLLEPYAPFCYLNHCCVPNAELCRYTFSGRADEIDLDEKGNPILDMGVVALRSIRKGEEIRIDYAWPADAAIPCGCHSPQCRGWIVDKNELHLLLKK